MKKRTVYILGAGFSANAGLPTTANFIDKAKAIGNDDLNKILKKIREFSAIKNYCESNLFNLEEAFSILAVDDLINGSNNAEEMKIFIKEVIKFYTPEKDLTIDNELYSNDFNWKDHIITGKYGKIFRFLSRIMLLKFSKECNEGKCIKVEKMDWEENNDIITFNYDTLLENCIEILNSRVLKGYEVSLELDKFHGSVESNNIIPPTFVKNGILNDVWKRALKKISKANRLVFIGYSLPKSDAYFRYFLKLALNKTKNLEEIKVICEDTNDIVLKNYEEFSKPIEFKFFNKKWEDIVSDFDYRYFKNPNSSSQSEKQSWWVAENDSGNKIFGWGTDTCKELYEKGIFID